MVKPDWDELQQQFLSDRATTSVSPKDRYEARGLDYATTRRYVEKPTAQTAQRPAQKELRTAQKEKCVEELVDNKLSPKVKRFVAKYLKDHNATAAAERVGYSDPNYGHQLLTNPNIAQAIAQQQKTSIVRTLGSADEVLEQTWCLATLDANQLSQYHRESYRYCWGFGRQYQWRGTVEFKEKLAKALAKKGKEPNDGGSYGYDHTNSPNPRYPRCNGDGIDQPFFADTRELAPDAALTYSGVKLGKNGVEITAISRERMYEAVMKRLSLADSEFTQRLRQVEIERRQLEIDKLRKELATDPEGDEPTPVAININVVDTRIRGEDGDNPDV